MLSLNTNMTLENQPFESFDNEFPIEHENFQMSCSFQGGYQKQCGGMRGSRQV